VATVIGKSSITFLKTSKFVYVYLVSHGRCLFEVSPLLFRWRLLEKRAQSLQTEEEKDAYNTWVYIPSPSLSSFVPCVNTRLTLNPAEIVLTIFILDIHPASGSLHRLDVGNFVGPAGIVVMIMLSNVVKNVPLLACLLDRNRQQRPLFLP
jgi:hypothetical protein